MRVILTSGLIYDNILKMRYEKRNVGIFLRKELIVKCNLILEDKSICEVVWLAEDIKDVINNG